MPTTAEDAIRRYLEFLSNPESAVDAEAVAAAEANVDATRESGDKLAELLARAELARVGQVNELMLEQGFVEHIGAYASDNSIPVDALTSMGVAEDVLRRAGLIKGSAARSSGVSKPAARSKRVSVPEIQEHIRAFSSGTTFTISDITEQMGSNPATTRKAIDLLPETEVSEVTDAEAIAKHSAGSRGRAPKVWMILP